MIVSAASRMFSAISFGVFYLEQRPAVRLGDQFLGVGFGVVDPLLDADVDLEPSMGHVELAQAIQTMLAARRRQEHARMPARDLHQALGGESRVVQELHGAQPRRWARYNGENGVGFQGVGITFNLVRNA